MDNPEATMVETIKTTFQHTFKTGNILLDTMINATTIMLAGFATAWIGSITSNTNVIPDQVQLELKGFSSQEVKDAQFADDVVGAIYGFVETKSTPTREERVNASKPVRNLMTLM